MKLKRAGILTKIVLIILIVYAVTTLISLRSQVENAKASQDQLEQQVMEKTASNEELKLAIENSTSDEIIEDVARDKLGLVMANEDIFYAE